MVDNGRGFGLAEVAGRHSGNQGLISTPERADLIDARLHVMTAPGRGTRVSLVVPVKPDQNTTHPLESPMPKKTPAQNNIRILVVDDHPLFRQGVRGALDAEPDMEVVGEAADGEQALTMAAELLPDVVLSDVNIPGPDGVEITRSLKGVLPRTPVILMTAYDDEEQLFDAIKVGAAAYFLKDLAPNELMDGIRRVSRGEYLINENVLSKPMVASRVLKQFTDFSPDEKEVEPLFVPLSNREIEVLDQIAKGNSNKEIARALKISDQTVKNHITSILRKLAVNDRTQAVVYAIRHGWIKMEELPK
ncbi:MAG TPA: response regulator [Chloroflexota bacterium]|nr:response regulator [Chloroflexota bacterium]